MIRQCLGNQQRQPRTVNGVVGVKMDATITFIVKLIGKHVPEIIYERRLTMHKQSIVLDLGWTNTNGGAHIALFGQVSRLPPL